MKWQTVRLKNILSAAGSGTWGGVPNGNEQTYPVLRSTNIQNGRLTFEPAAMRAVSEKTAEKYLLKKGDILVTTSSGSPRHIGKNAIVEEFPGHRTSFLYSNFTWRLRPDSNILIPKYLYYYLNSSVARAELDRIQSTTSGLRNLNTKLYLTQSVPLPPLPEQSRIVEILDQADHLRQLRAKADAKADQVLPALFLKMFGDPSTNPMNWPNRPLARFLSPVNKRDPSAEPDQSFIYVDIAGVDGPSGEIVDTKVLLGAEAPSRARQIIRTGDVLVSTVRPYLRATAKVPKELDGQICSTGFSVLRAKRKSGQGYLYALSRTYWFTEQLVARARGASYPAVTNRDIWKMQVPLPNDQVVIRRCNRMVKAILENRRNRKIAKKRIDALFNSLLLNIFSASRKELRTAQLQREFKRQTKRNETSRISQRQEGGSLET